VLLLLLLLLLLSPGPPRCGMLPLPLLLLHMMAVF
jgi:hypothetical protein